MAGKPVCLVCKKDMIRGFVTDHDFGSLRIPRWHTGDPKPSLSGDVSRDQTSQGLKIVAYRCPECAALRLYAPEVHA